MKNKWLLAVIIIITQMALVVSLVEARQVSDFSGIEEKLADGANYHPEELALQIETPTEAPPLPANTEDALPLERPIIVIKSYYTDPPQVDAGTNFTLHFTLKNNGGSTAKNIIISFSATNFSPLETGGVISKKELTKKDTTPSSQKFYAAPGLWGYVVEPLQITISYSDEGGASYSETFNVSIALAPVPYIAPTATPTVSVSRPRLLVTQAKTNIEILQPGSQFELFLDIANMGSETARSVNMVVGGATMEMPSGTDTPGGSYTATGGDFTNFSPLGGSNVQSLGDITTGSTFTASQPLIVNVTTNPGAFTLKISFIYMNSKGETLVDDQVITLLVQSVPMVDISFYRDPGELFTFQPGPLPIQIVNLGKKSVILGSMHISASSGMVDNASMQIGYLDTGGYLTQDAMLTADTPGEVDITVSVDYVDDFNQPQTITKQLTVNVVDMPPMEIPPEDMGMGEPVMQPSTETFIQKVWRFIKGLLGLDSSPQQNPIQGEPGMPVEGLPIEGEVPIKEATAAPIKGP